MDAVTNEIITVFDVVINDELDQGFNLRLGSESSMSLIKIRKENGYDYIRAHNRDILVYNNRLSASKLQKELYDSGVWLFYLEITTNAVNYFYFNVSLLYDGYTLDVLFWESVMTTVDEFIENYDTRRGNDVDKSLVEVFKSVGGFKRFKTDFKCSICCHYFSTEQSTLDHIKIVHFKQLNYSCKICSQLSGTKYVIERHIRTNHVIDATRDDATRDATRDDGTVNFKSIMKMAEAHPFSTITSADRLNYKLELKSNRNQKVINELEIDSNIMVEENEENTQINDNAKLFFIMDRSNTISCNLCHATIRSLNKAKHFKRVHQKLVVGTCEKCSRSFSRQDAFANHYKNNRYVCQVRDCCESFNSANVYETHKSNHQANNLIKCKDCAKYIHQLRVLRHMNNHKPSNQYVNDNYAKFVTGDYQRKQLPYFGNQTTQGDGKYPRIEYSLPDNADEIIASIVDEF